MAVGWSSSAWTVLDPCFDGCVLFSVLGFDGCCLFFLCVFVQWLVDVGDGVSSDMLSANLSHNAKRCAVTELNTR